MPDVWLLSDGDEALAQIEVSRLDMPWWQGRLVARPRFEPLRALFEERTGLLDRDSIDWERFEALSGQIEALGLVLIPPDGEAMNGFFLHLKGEGVRFRC
jgi:hypothetical protein